MCWGVFLWGVDCLEYSSQLLLPFRHCYYFLSLNLKTSCIVGSIQVSSIKTVSWHHLRYSVCVHAKSLQSCPTLCNPMDCSPPGSSVHGTFQARTLEWVAISYSNSYAWEYTTFQAPFIRETFLLHCMILKPLWKSLGHWNEDLFLGSVSLHWSWCLSQSQHHMVLIHVLL